MNEIWDIAKSINAVALQGLKSGREIGMQDARARISALADALEWILPMAKGYAAEHPVGRNAEIVASADRVLQVERDEGAA